MVKGPGPPPGHDRGPPEINPHKPPRLQRNGPSAARPPRAPPPPTRSVGHGAAPNPVRGARAGLADVAGRRLGRHNRLAGKERARRAAGGPAGGRAKQRTGAPGARTKAPGVPLTKVRGTLRRAIRALPLETLPVERSRDTATLG